MSIAVFTNGMHDLLMREVEVGWRVACAEDDEQCGFGPLLDHMFRLDAAEGRV